MIEVTPTTILDLQRLSKKFGELSVEMLDVGTEAAGKYLLKKVKDDIPPYKYVSRKQAYGKTFFSDAQRRWFFANRIWEKVPYSRTNAIRDGWRMEGSGMLLVLANDAPGVDFVYGETQARQIGMVGWKKISSTIDNYEKNATDSASRAIDKLIKGKGL